MKKYFFQKYKMKNKKINIFFLKYKFFFLNLKKMREGFDKI